MGRAISARGDVVGYGDDVENDATHAFLDTDAVGMQDLNDLVSEEDRTQWTLEYGCLISDMGEILGVDLLADQPHIFRLVPLPSHKRP